MGKSKKQLLPFFATLPGRFSITRYAGSAGIAVSKATALSSFVADDFVPRKRQRNQSL